MITIRIQGPRGSGKTTAAIAIARLLRRQGQEVQYVGGTNASEKIVNELIADDDPPPFLQPQKYRLLDVDVSE